MLKSLTSIFSMSGNALPPNALSTALLLRRGGCSLKIENRISNLCKIIKSKGSSKFYLSSTAFASCCKTLLSRFTKVTKWRNGKLPYNKTIWTDRTEEATKQDRALFWSCLIKSVNQSIVCLSVKWPVLENLYGAVQIRQQILPALPALLSWIIVIIRSILLLHY